MSPGSEYRAAVGRIQTLLRAHGDLALAIALTGIGAIETLTDSRISTGQKLANLVVLGGLAALLTVRRRVPLVLLGLAFAGALMERWIGEAGQGEVFGLILLVTVYTAAAHTDSVRMWLAAAMTTATAVVVLVNEPDNVDFGGLLFSDSFLALRGSQVARSATADYGRAGSSTRRPRPRRRSSRSGLGSRASSTTSWRTRSA